MQCNINRDWYIQVKEESEESVEAAAYSQMCKIKEFGDYKIGSAKEVHYDIHEVFSLEVRDQKRCERSYTLAELQELQSKLLLTTKSDTDKRKFVDAFSDVSVVYIFEVELIIHVNTPHLNKSFPPFFHSFQHLMASVFCNVLMWCF